MAKIIRSITINAPVEKVFEYMDDPCNLPNFWPSMLEAQVSGPAEVGGYNFEWEYKMAGVRLRGASEIVERIPNRKMVTMSKKGVESRFTWSYEPEGEATRMTVEAEYTIPVPVLGKLAESVIARNNEREADILLANLKTIMEG